MPVVMRIAGYRIVIFTNDHRPPHVHIIGSDGQVVVSIEAVPRILRIEGFSDREALKLAKEVGANADTLLKEWEVIHGKK